MSRTNFNQFIYGRKNGKFVGSKKKKRRVKCGIGVVIVDFPTSCATCDLCHESEYDCRYRIEGEKICGVENLNVSGYREGRPDWCPIRSTPNKLSGSSDPYDEYDTGYCTGWDSCLEKILGDEVNER